jgi:hypothetical protein
MSVSYHFTAVWGIAGAVDYDEDLFRKFGFEDGDWDKLYSEPEIVPGIKLFIGGDQMSGPRSWSLVVYRTQLRVDGRGENYPHGHIDVVNKLKEPTANEKIAHGLAANMLGLEDEYEPGWLFLKDVG